ncbi:hypothetical protein CASFOL_024247 [Castilleja foliolosa]|uniref:Uncharacterized protein n=1 Tax=Castilleja foliolosa TaxID=1961234 RepID=A0ABD3CNN7_9LAMI
MASDCTVFSTSSKCERQLSSMRPLLRLGIQKQLVVILISRRWAPLNILLRRFSRMNIRFRAASEAAHSRPLEPNTRDLKLPKLIFIILMAEGKGIIRVSAIDSLRGVVIESGNIYAMNNHN